MKNGKPGRGGTLKRDQTVGVRLDEKLRYLAELAARKQHRTVSSYIEWAVHQSLASVELNPAARAGDKVQTIATEAEKLWDIEPAHRFALLATTYPELLSHQEQLIWSLVKRNRYFWTTPYKDESMPGRINDERLRKCWDDLNAVAKNEKDESVLPTAK